MRDRVMGIVIHHHHRLHQAHVYGIHPRQAHYRVDYSFKKQDVSWIHYIIRH